MPFPLQHLVLFTALFAPAQWFVSHYSLKWASASTVGRGLNLMYGTASGAFCVCLLLALAMDEEFIASLRSSGISTAVFGISVPSSLNYFFQIYYFSKMWESTDIFMVALQGFSINLHFRVHHNTTPLLAWALLTQKSVGGIVFMALNTLMHFFVYLYFGGCSGSFMFYATRIIGHVQLLAGMLFAGGTAITSVKLAGAYDGIDQQQVLIGSILPLFLYIIYFGLFQLEIYDDAKTKAKAAKNKGK
jgi:hypothetical protein